MKIYTRGGDQGQTSLFSGARVGKDDARIEALGAIDELVAALGLAKAAAGADEVHGPIEDVQRKLYLVMSDIAAGEPGAGRLPGGAVGRLEAAIDAADAQLPALTDFLIPGASPGSAALHLARTVCRRAERRCGSAARDHAIPAPVPAYLNRLSDYLFVLARWVDREVPGGASIFKERLRDKEQR